MDIGDIGGEAWSWDTPTAITVAADLWQVTMADTAAARVGGLSLMQTTDLGEAQHEVLLFRYVAGNTTGGSGGGTPTNMDLGFGPSSAVDSVACRNTTAASGGSPGSGQVQGWNILSPIDIWYPNGLEPILWPAYGISYLTVVRMLAAPADSVTMHSTLWIRAGAYYSS